MDEHGGDLQSPCTNNKRNPKFPLRRHLEMPNQINRYAQHHDIRYDVESRRCYIQRIDIEAMSRKIGVQIFRRGVQRKIGMKKNMV